MNICCKIGLFALLLDPILMPFALRPVSAQRGLSSGELTKQHIVRSEALGEDRVVSVCVPASYGGDSEHYPVLVVLDGDDFLRPFAGVVEYYSKLGRCPELIVVGVDSDDRWRDYTPTQASIPDGTLLPTSGGGERFGRFIHDELLSFVRSEYRITPCR